MNPTEQRHRELTALLEAALRAQSISEPVTELVRLSGGASRETWSFVAGQPFILQRRGPGSAASEPAAIDAVESEHADDEPAAITTSVSVEATLLAEAARAGVPVAAVVATGDGVDDGFATPWVITERVDGETLPKLLVHGDGFAGVRPSLAADCGRALAAIHSIDPSTVASALRDTDEIEALRAVLDAVPGDYPTFELVLRWLELNPAPSRPTAVVHGDFRTGNLLIRGDASDRPGLAAVLDWELTHLGNPIEDLGWFCVRAWRFGSPHVAGGFGSVDQLLDGYRSASGTDVEVDELRWWQLLGTVKWGVICAMQAGYHLTGATRSVELAAIGRRAAENEHDALVLLESMAREVSR